MKLRIGFNINKIEEDGLDSELFWGFVNDVLENGIVGVYSFLSSDVSLQYVTEFISEIDGDEEDYLEVIMDGDYLNKVCASDSDYWFKKIIIDFDLESAKEFIENQDPFVLADAIFDKYGFEKQSEKGVYVSKNKLKVSNYIKRINELMKENNWIAQSITRFSGFDVNKTN